MAPVVASAGASGGAGPSLGVRAACVAAAATTALALALWLAWPRRPKASREQALEALRRLREECAAVYAEVAACAAAAGLPELPSNGLTKAAADADAAAKARATQGSLDDEDEDEDGEAASPQSETSETRLRQAVEQPLVLAEALREAAVVAAAALPEGGSAEDLEAELQRFSADTRVQEATAELQAMHEACLHGRGPELSEACAVGPWTPEAALETLRELGRSKAQAVRNLVSAARAAGPDGQEAQCLGAKVVQACARAEEEVWGKLWPGDRSRRCCFLPALDHFEAADRRFCERRASAECELAALAAAAGTGR